MQQKTYILSDENIARLRALAASRKKPPAVQVRMAAALYERLEKAVASRDQIRPFVEEAVTMALDAIGA